MKSVLLLKPDGEWEIVSITGGEGNYKELHKLLECRCFSMVQRRIGNKVYDIWHDDEFLLKENNEIGDVTALCDDVIEMLFGNLIIANHEGEEISSLTGDDIDNIVRHIKVYNGEWTNVEYETSCGTFSVPLRPKQMALIYNI